MKTTFRTVIGAGALLGLAGCSQPGPPGTLVTYHTIEVTHSHTRPGDKEWRKERKAHWTMKEKAKDVLCDLEVHPGDMIEWHLPCTNGSFSIVVTNQTCWKVEKAAQGSWRTDVPCPFNDTNVGVADSVDMVTNMVVILSVKTNAPANRSGIPVGYMMTVPTVATNELKDSVRVMNSIAGFSMVDATMAWTSSFANKTRQPTP